MIKFEQVDFKALVDSNNCDSSLNFRCKIVDELNNTFTEDEKRWYIGNLYMYLNYDSTKDYPINLDNIWKLLGFAHKANAKRTLENHFKVNDDYKISLIPTDERFHTKGGENKETIMLNVDTFKNFCMLTKTEKAKEIRKYYVKLENIFNKLMKEEMEENKKLLEDKEKQLKKQKKENEEKEKQLEEQKKENEKKEKQLEKQKKETEEKEKIIKTLTTKPETESFNRNPGYIYIIKDTSKECHYKIGYANDPVARVSNLNTSSSTYSLEILVRYYTCDKDFAEKTIHRALQPFRIKNRKEWFFIKNNTELAYMIYTVRDCIEYTHKYNIQSYDEIENLNINVEGINCCIVIIHCYLN